MVPNNRGKLVEVWVPVSRAVGWPNTVVVEDAFNREHTVGRGPYCFFEDDAGQCRLGLGAAIIGPAGAGLYRVRFRDGKEIVARIEESQWEPLPEVAA